LRISLNYKKEKTMQDTINAEDDKGPTEKLRDDQKSDAGESVPAASGVPGAQKPDNEAITDEKGPNTE
jgi:hypothetical protein